MATVTKPDPDAALLDMEIEWFDSTKEKLSPDDVLKGLLDYGLFAEKIPPSFRAAGLVVPLTSAWQVETC